MSQVARKNIYNGFVKVKRKTVICTLGNFCIFLIIIPNILDPYVKLRLYDDNKVICKWKSSIKRNTLVPIYNETFQFDIHGRDIEILSMEVLVMDYDRFSRDDIMGVLMLGSNVKRHSEARHWKEMILHPNQSISQWHSLRNDNN